MKTLLFPTFAAAGLLAFASCSSDEELETYTTHTRTLDSSDPKNMTSRTTVIEDRTETETTTNAVSNEIPPSPSVHASGNL